MQQKNDLQLARNLSINFFEPRCVSVAAIDIDTPCCAADDDRKRDGCGSAGQRIERHLEKSRELLDAKMECYKE